MPATTNSMYLVYLTPCVFFLFLLQTFFSLIGLPEDSRRKVVFSTMCLCIKMEVGCNEWSMLRRKEMSKEGYLALYLFFFFSSIGLL